MTQLNAAGTALNYSTYLGGGSIAHARAVALDETGEALVVGHTQSSQDFPKLGSLQRFGGGVADAFVARLVGDGSQLSFSTSLGGDGHDNAVAVAADNAGLIHLVGTTNSSDFPTVDPLQAGFAGDRDGFVSLIDPQAAALNFSTYLSGSDKDTLEAVAPDPAAGRRDGHRLHL